MSNEPNTQEERQKRASLENGSKRPQNGPNTQTGSNAPKTEKRCSGREKAEYSIKECYISAIKKQLKECNSLEMLNLIYRLLQKEKERPLA